MKRTIFWPLLIVAGLLPAAVESHHSVAFTPHILADYPLGGVAGTSPEKRQTFFQLHSVEIEKTNDTFMDVYRWRILFCYQEDPHFSGRCIYPADPCSPAASIFFFFLFLSFSLAVHYPDGALHCLIFKRCPSCCHLFPKRTIGCFRHACFPPANQIIKAQTAPAILVCTS